MPGWCGSSGVSTWSTSLRTEARRCRRIAGRSAHAVRRAAARTRAARVCACRFSESATFSSSFHILYSSESRPLENADHASGGPCLQVFSQPARRKPPNRPAPFPVIPVRRQRLGDPANRSGEFYQIPPEQSSLPIGLPDRRVRAAERGRRLHVCPKHDVSSCMWPVLCTPGRRRPEIVMQRSSVGTTPS